MTVSFAYVLMQERAGWSNFLSFVIFAKWGPTRFEVGIVNPHLSGQIELIARPRFSRTEKDFLLLLKVLKIQYGKVSKIYNH